MIINFDFHLDVEGSKILRFGSYKIAPHKVNDEYVIKLAYHRYRELLKEHGYRKTVIEKVLYNGDQDITEQVRGADREYHKEVKW